MKKDHCKILNEIIEAYYGNEYPEYFQDDVSKIFKKENITKEYKAEPVKHGKWVFSSDDREGTCSRCNYKIYGRPYQNTYMIVPYNYCPNCGAKMNEVEENG